MELHELIKVKIKSQKRLGRGVGSGRGKTSGRGTKGQKARGKMPVGFSGDVALFKKLPKKLGQGNIKVSEKPTVLNLSSLSVFKAGGTSGTKTTVDLEQLIKMKILNKKNIKRGVKILGGGEIKAALVVKLPTSASARKKIEDAGGKVENV